MYVYVCERPLPFSSLDRSSTTLIVIIVVHTVIVRLVVLLHLLCIVMSALINPFHRIMHQCQWHFEADNECMPCNRYRGGLLLVFICLAIQLLTMDAFVMCEFKVGRINSERREAAKGTSKIVSNFRRCASWKKRKIWRKKNAESTEHTQMLAKYYHVSLLIQLYM